MLRCKDFTFSFLHLFLQHPSSSMIDVCTIPDAFFFPCSQDVFWIRDTYCTHFSCLVFPIKSSCVRILKRKSVCKYTLSHTKHIWGNLIKSCVWQLCHPTMSGKVAPPCGQVLKHTLQHTTWSQMVQLKWVLFVSVHKVLRILGYPICHIMISKATLWLQCCQNVERKSWGQHLGLDLSAIEVFKLFNEAI